MRVVKNKTGVIASLVFVIGVMTLRCSLLWAQTGAEPSNLAPVPTNMKEQGGMPAMPPKTPPSLGENVQGPPPGMMPSPGMQPPRGMMPPPGMQPPPGMPPMATPPSANGEKMAAPPPSRPSDFATSPSSSGGPPPRMPPSGAVPDDNAFGPGQGFGAPPARRGAGVPPSSVRAREERGSSRSSGSDGPKNRQAPVNDSDVFKVVPQKCVPAKAEFTWNFEEEELIAILRQVSDLLCRTIVVNDSIGKNLKMTIIGKSTLSPRDAWDVLNASLAAKGFALIEQGKTWTVIKRNESKSYATPMYGSGKQARNNEEIGTLFYKTQHASQDALKNVARSLISKDGMVESIGDQFIIIIDSNSNIRRLGGIFAQIDIEDAINKIHILSLLNAEAKTVEKQLKELFDVASGPRTGPMRRRGGPSESKSNLDIDKIIADERTNSLIIVSDKEAADKLKEVIALMDQPAADQGNKGKIHVKKLRFADAKKIAETLTTVVTQGKSGSRFGRRRGDEPTNEIFEGEVKITAHENTNTLVTLASASDYRSLLATINSLDVRKEQVYVEAVILDIQVNDNNDFGINLFAGLDPNWIGGHLGVVGNPGGSAIASGISGALTKGATGAQATGLGNHGMGALAVLSNFLTGGVAGISGKPIPGTEIPSFGAVLQAISRNNQVDVLSTPYLLTTDNQEAEMSVGEKVPVVRGTSMAGAGGIGAALGVPLQNIAYEDVKLTFKITPHVGADNNVRLDINQEVNELGGEENILNQKQYRIRTKSAKTQLVLKDQQTGVIGGLIGHHSTISDNKVPLLGDIPLLGWLFKSRNTKNERKNLLLIITPYIIRTDDDYKKIVDRKLKEREEFAQMYYGGKIKTYNKYIDYDKKAGPLTTTFLQMKSAMSEAANGGAGSTSETVIKPKDNNFEPGRQPESNSNGDGGLSGSDQTVFHDAAPTYSEDDVVLDEFGSSSSAPPPDSGGTIDLGSNP